MRMMHESRLWVVHLMIKVLMRIRLLEVLVVHLRHRVEESGIVVVVVVVVVVLLLLLINRPARVRRLRRRRRMEAQLLHILFFVVWSPPRRGKNKATRLNEMLRQGRQGEERHVTLLFLWSLPFFRENQLSCSV